MENQVDVQQQPSATNDRLEAVNQASAKLGQYLLQGWTMLADTCPNPACYGTPMMRKGLQTPLCVVCSEQVPSNQPFAEVSKATPKASKTPKKKQIVLSTAYKSVASSSESSKVEKGTSTLPMKRELSNGLDTVPAASEAQIRRITIEVGLEALTSKLEQLAQQLENERCPHKIRAIAEAMTACANAIVAYDKLHK